MSFQAGCSVEESVTIRATKGLEEGNFVAHVTYMIFVSQKSDSDLVLLQIPSSQFTYNVPLYRFHGRE